MSYGAKTMNIKAVLAKLEASYGAGATLSTTTDGHLLSLSDRNAAIGTLAYAYDGALGSNAANQVGLPRVAPSGRSVQAGLPFRVKPGGAAYSASVMPSINTWLRAAGFGSTLVTTSGSESYTYAPQTDADGFASLGLELYQRGEKWTVKGGLCNWSYQAGDLGVPLHTFDVQGICSDAIADASVPAPTFPLASVAEVTTPGAVVSIGSFVTPKVRSISYNSNRSLQANPILTVAGGHAGFTHAGFDPEFSVTIDATALVASPYHTSAGLDPYQLRESAAQIAVSVQFGSTKYFKWKHSFTKAQLIDVVPGNAGPVATVELKFKPVATSYTANDWCSVLFD